MIRVLLVDDHAMVRSGIAAMLGVTDDIEVVGQAADGADAVTAVPETSPDVILMDLSMPGVDGVEATRQILGDHPDVRIVVLTSFSDRARVSDAMAAGAVGYQLKDCEPAELLATVRAAAAGRELSGDDPPGVGDTTAEHLATEDEACADVPTLAAEEVVFEAFEFEEFDEFADVSVRHEVAFWP